MLKVYLLFLVAMPSCYAQLGSKCTTPDGGTGVCRDLEECPKLMNSLNNLRYVISHHCGKNNGFCCSDCYTPDGKSGVCTNITECGHLTSLMFTREAYVRNSICANSQQICCGPPPPPVARQKCKNYLSAFPPDPASECCGRDGVLGSKIMGGNATKIEEYPWLVILEYRVGRKTKLDCGGALISSKYVLTAAHCVTGRNAKQLKSVRVGEYDTSNEGQDCDEANENDCTEPAVSVPVEEIVVHPEHNTTTKWNDIALIRLSQMVNYTDFVRPICLPTADFPKNVPLAHFEAYAAGWGKVNSYVPLSDKKQHVRLPLVSLQVCHSKYQRSGYILWSKQLCAGGERGKDTCKGDSGGPLMAEMPTTKLGSKFFEAIGVVSYGPETCGTNGVPGVYTKVYEYNTWIRTNIKP